MSIGGIEARGVIIDELVGPEGWAGRIGAAWQKSVEAIFETGRLIAEAKAALPHGEFGTMIANDLPFGDRTARMLMTIAADERLTNRQHVSVLPPSWGTLYELTKLDDDTLTRRIKEGTIRPDMQRRDVATGGARSIMASREQNTESLDFFPTPPWATRALIERVFPALGVTLDGMSVVDPCCGEGHMTGVLLEYGGIGNVAGSDIKNYRSEAGGVPAFAGQIDFLADHEIEADWIITNPPFGELTLKVALKALSLARKGVALFVRQQWLEGVERYETLFRDAPPTLYAQFAERVNLCGGKWEPLGSTATAYCWLVWVKDMLPQPVFWIPPGQRVGLRRDDDIERFTAHPVLPPSSFAPPSALAGPSPEPPPESHTASAPKSDTSPFRSTLETDAIIRAGYGAGVDLAAIAARLSATKLQVRRRANQLGLGSRDRQREVVARANAARGGAA